MGEEGLTTEELHGWQLKVRFGERFDLCAVVTIKVVATKNCEG